MKVPTYDEMYSALEKRHGAELQRKFASARVAVCGLGGLGSNIAIALARAGIGELHLFDFDKVDLTNLNRQQYAVRHLGLPKTDALREIIAEIAPYCKVTAVNVRLCRENIPQLLSDAPIICEAFDKAEQKAMLVNCALESLPNSVVVAASGMAGLGFANEITTRKISKRLYLCGDGKSDVEGNSLFSARVMLCAAHQALAVLQIIAESQ